MAKNKLRNQGFQPNNNHQQQRPNVPAQTNPQSQTTEASVVEAEVATLEDVAADIEMMDAQTAEAYYLTYEDMVSTHAEMSRCGVPTVYITKMMADVLDLMEVNETEGGLIRTKADVEAEILNMETVAKSANETLGFSIDLYTDDTPAGKKFRELFAFDEAAPANQSEGGREVLIPKANEAALDQIFMEWAALSLTGYNAIATDKEGNTSWLYNGLYDSVDAMYSQEEVQG